MKNKKSTGRITRMARRGSHDFPQDERYQIDHDSFREQLLLANVQMEEADRILRVLEHFVFLLGEMPRELMRGDIGGYPALDTYNIIPQDADGDFCADIVIASATTTGSPDHRFLPVMRQLRGHLISCGAATKTVIVLTDSWEPGKFKESEIDLRAYRAKGMTIITGLLTPGRVIALHNPF